MHTGLVSGFAANKGKEAQISYTRSIFVASQDFVRIHVGESLATVEQRLIEQTLRHCRTKDEAARMLGVSNKTLYNKLRRYHLERAAGAAGQAALGRTLHAS